jgi:hypothetical protein
MRLPLGHRSRPLLVLTAALASLAACTTINDYHCKQASECPVGGECLAGLCTQPDTTCPSGQRYVPLTMGGACVPTEAGAIDAAADHSQVDAAAVEHASLDAGGDSAVTATDAPSDHPVAVADASTDSARPDTTRPDTTPVDSMPPDACPTGSILCTGTCTAQSMASCGCPAAACDPHVADHCAAAQGCQCGGGPPCGAGSGCCGGVCVALDTAANCGNCGVICSGTNGCFQETAGPMPFYTCQCATNVDCTSPLAPRCSPLMFCECGSITSGPTGGHCDGVLANQCSDATATGLCDCGTGAECTTPDVCKASSCTLP